MPDVQNIVTSNLIQNDSQPTQRIGKLLKTLIIINFILYPLGMISTVLTFFKEGLTIWDIYSLGLSLLILFLLINMWKLKKWAIMTYLVLLSIGLIVFMWWILILVLWSQGSDPKQPITSYIFPASVIIFYLGYVSLWIFAVKKEWSAFK